MLLQILSLQGLFFSLEVGIVVEELLHAPFLYTLGLNILNKGLNLF